MDDVIFKRTSIRKFTVQPVEREQLDQIMRAGMAAPSAGNQQPWEFFVAQDEQTKERLSQASPYAKPAAQAAAVIVACQRAEGLMFAPCAPQDMGACMENMLLEATALGLGGVWLGIAPEQDRMDAVSDILGEQATGLLPFALFALGHPEEELEPRSAKRLDEERIHWL